MKVLFLTRYSRTGASSRLRTYQYLEFLESAGVRCVVNPLFDDAYLKELYQNKKHNRWMVITAFARRVLALFTVFRYDRVIIEKELFPFFPSLFERLLWLMNIKYIVDYDDAVFHNYDKHPSPLVRFLLGNKIGNVMKFSAVTVAGNEYISRKAIESGALKVVVIPTVIDLAKYAGRTYPSQDIFTIGWIGSPVTFKYLPPLKIVFEELAMRYRIRITLIGSGEALGLTKAEERVIPWSEETEVRDIQSFDVGIMPLEDNFWERGKCGYKLIQYMGCSVPVVGSPVGVNDVIIQDGVNGFKATTIEEWKSKLEFMIQNPGECRQLGERGRNYVEQYFSLLSFGKIWLALLEENAAG